MSKPVVLAAPAVLVHGRPDGPYALCQYAAPWVGALRGGHASGGSIELQSDL